MRRAIIPLALIVTLSLAGCATSDNPVESRAKQTPDQTKTIADLDGVTLIRLPKLNSLQKAASVTGLITTRKGGTVKLSDRAGSTKVNLTLSFKPGSVQEDTYVTIILDDEVLAMTFGPSGLSFLKPGNLDVNAEGLDLSYMPPGTGKDDVKLLFYDAMSGTWKEMPARSIKVNVKDGHLQCEDGSIPHFSVYAFGIIRK